METAFTIKLGHTANWIEKWKMRWKGMKEYILWISKLKIQIIDDMHLYLVKKTQM